MSSDAASDHGIGHAVLLAGGRGTRLRPFTHVFPKPLMPLGEVPVLELLVRQLSNSGITDITLAIGYLGHLIQAYCGDGSRFGVRIGYSQETAPLGTAGPLAALLDALPERFVVCNGDLLTTFDIPALLRFHRDRGSAATVTVVHRPDRCDFGVIETDADDRLVRYIEKPVTDRILSIGLYVFEREILRKYLAPGAHLDMPELIRRMVAGGERVLCHAQDRLWLDIGRPEDYQEACDLFLSDPQRFLPGTTPALTEARSE
jgi:NDP-sugar pyrophosphorylase family protein